MRLTDRFDSDGSDGVVVLVLFTNGTGRMAIVSKESIKHHLFPRHCQSRKGMPLEFRVRQDDTFNPAELLVKDVLFMPTKRINP